MESKKAEEGNEAAANNPPLVQDVMTRGAVTAEQGSPLTEVVSLMAEAHVGAAAIVDAQGSLVGIFTERDLLEKTAVLALDLRSTTVGEVMTSRPMTIDAKSPLSSVWQAISEKDFRHVPVVLDGKLVGMLSMRDVFRLRLWSMETRLDQEVRALQQLRTLIDLDADDRAKELLRINERLSQLALTDDLTGLYNHRYLMQRLQEEFSRSVRYNMSMSLLFIDIDRFKRVNDMHGHAAGDEVLRGFAQLLRNTIEGDSVLAHIRRYDVVARYGGEEFALLLPMTDTGAALVVAERVRAKVESTTILFQNDQSVAITISIGVATIPEHASDVEGLMAAADEALYVAKNSGRNQVKHA